MFSLPANQRKIVNDSNGELINAYLALRDDLDGVLHELRKLRNNQLDYVRVRSWDRLDGFDRLGAAVRAARFVYLNKCGFNGLYRVNSSGFFNVPYGNSPRARFIDEDVLRNASRFLRARTKSGHRAISIGTGGYLDSLQHARKGDFVYLDPPYDPTSKTASFVAYSRNGFGQDDQEQLRDECLRLTKRGVAILLSNSSTKLIRGLYADPSIFQIDKVRVRRAIAAQKSSRRVVDEVLISNRPALS
jgi:DNA adenine methylase